MKNVIIAKWSDGRIEAFTSLLSFCDQYPNYSQHTLNNWLSRKKEDYQDDDLRLSKREVRGRNN